MTTLRLALSELKRMTSGRLPRLAIFAMCLVPLLYGALYLYANWDPYAHLHNVKAAIVNLDAGSEQDGKELQVGDDVTKELLDDGTFGWTVVKSEAEAEAGVASGDYSFSMTIPKDFSANLASPGDFEKAQQAILKITTNDANNYMVGTFADKLAGQVHNTVAKEVGTQTADALLTGFSDIHTNMVKAADGAGDLHTGTVKLSDGVGTLADGVGSLNEGATKLDTGAGDLGNGANTLHEGTSSLVSGQKKLAKGADQLADGAGTLADGTKDLNAGLGQLKSKTKELPAKTKQLDDGADTAAEASKKLSAGAAQVAAGNKALDDKVSQAADTITALEKDAEKRLDAAKATLDARTAELIKSGAITQAQADELTAAVKQTAGSSGIETQVADTKKQLATARSQISALADGSAQVAAGAKELSGGLSTLADGTGQLAGAMPALKSGISDAAAGASKLNDGAHTLASGASTLAGGQRDALAGAKKLDTGAGSLAAGANTLHEGTGTLVAGVKDLGDGVGELGSGATELKDGAGELSTKLADGSARGSQPEPDHARTDLLRHRRPRGHQAHRPGQGQRVRRGPGTVLHDPCHLDRRLHPGADHAPDHQARTGLQRRELEDRGGRLAAVPGHLDAPGHDPLRRGALRPRPEHRAPVDDLGIVPAGVHGVHGDDPGHLRAAGHPRQDGGAGAHGAAAGLLRRHLPVGNHPGRPARGTPLAAHGARRHRPAPPDVRRGPVRARTHRRGPGRLHDPGPGCQHDRSTLA